MTFDEYLIRLEAFQLRTIKRNEELAYQAWLNQQVQATTGSSKNPKPKFPLTSSIILLVSKN